MKGKAIGMPKKHVKNRQYDSTHRQNQARLTRQTITVSARKLFLEKGYSGATISEIAREAGVSAETIYATFGNKRAILAHVADVAVAGDDEPVSLLDRPFVKQTDTEPDQRQQIQMFAEQIWNVMGRMAPIFEVMRTAAKTEADIAEMRSNMLHERQQGMAYFVRSVMAHGSLRQELSVEEATDIIFALSSGEMFTVFTSDLGWSGEKYVKWLTDALCAALLPD